jgi:hypothetical protein
VRTARDAAPPMAPFRDGAPRYAMPTRAICSELDASSRIRLAHHPREREGMSPRNAARPHRTRDPGHVATCVHTAARPAASFRAAPWKLYRRGRSSRVASNAPSSRADLGEYPQNAMRSATPSARATSRTPGAAGHRRASPLAKARGEAGRAASAATHRTKSLGSFCIDEAATHPTTVMSRVSLAPACRGAVRRAVPGAAPMAPHSSVGGARTPDRPDGCCSASVSR